MKNLKLIKVLAILCVIVLWFLVVLSQKYQIKLSSNQTGWIANVNIEQAKVKFKTKTHKRVTPNENIVATVEVNGLNVQEHPSLSSLVVGKLNLGTKVTVNDEQSG